MQRLATWGEEGTVAGNGENYSFATAEGRITLQMCLLLEEYNYYQLMALQGRSQENTYQISLSSQSLLQLVSLLGQTQSAPLGWCNPQSFLEKTCSSIKAQFKNHSSEDFHAAQLEKSCHFLYCTYWLVGLVHHNAEWGSDRCPGFRSQLCHLLNVRLLSVSKPKFTQLYNGDNSLTYFKMPLGGFIQIILIKHSIPATYWVLVVLGVMKERC
nr:PREDICTED: uncharacterized protein LOC103549149 [Equus przewalskii]